MQELTVTYFNPSSDTFRELQNRPLATVKRIATSRYFQLDPIGPHEVPLYIPHVNSSLRQLIGFMTSYTSLCIFSKRQSVIIAIRQSEECVYMAVRTRNRYAFSLLPTDFFIEALSLSTRGKAYSKCLDLNYRIYAHAIDIQKIKEYRRRLSYTNVKKYMGWDWEATLQISR
ncbi:hypothetical protein KAZ66_02815 [Candidatus Woesebacteria bacterium]|nr:hypothetical protein [Candidatus Woesebacteria bacterium]